MIMDENKEKLQIDIDNILSTKKIKMPGFVVNYLKKITHQDEMNQFLAENHTKYGIDFSDAVIDFFKVNIHVENIERIPATGRYILVSNHPLGGLDGLALISTVGKIRKDIFFPVNDLLLYLKNMSNIFIPLNKHGRNSQTGIGQLNDAFESDAMVLYFPAGLCSRKQKNGICDLEWKKTVITKAKQFKRDIIPVHFEGRNSNFFYNLANLRKFFGIKANIEMLYLSDEMYKQRNKSFKITVGNPISYETFTKEKKDIEWSAWLKDQVYALNNNNK